jgi:glycosyltransferase involved in cell wall biosynthesis
MVVSDVFVSVVAPAHNEAACIERFVLETSSALDDAGLRYELICVDDGSTDGTREILCALKERFARLRILALPCKSGQSAAVAAGVAAARGQLIALMDSDLQNDPVDIVRMSSWLSAADEVDCVVGVRTVRRDNWLRRVSSVVANWCAARITGTRFRDSGCGIKVCRAALLKRIRMFDGAHRLIAHLVVMEEGEGRVVEMEVNHRPRYAGASKYGRGLGRTFVALRDARGIRWLADRKIRLAVEEL